MIDMTFYSPYNADLGFRFGVEAIHANTQTSCFYGVIASLCPEASFYDANRKEPPGDSVPFSNIDMQSSVATHKFTDGQVAIQNIPEAAGMSIIFDVKKITAGGKQYEHFGFAVFPMFSQLQNEGVLESYVNSGIFSLPLYQGQPTPELVNQLKTTKDSNIVLQQAASKLKLLDTTIIIKCLDSQREVRNITTNMVRVTSSRTSRRYFPRRSSFPRLRKQSSSTNR